MSIGDGLIVAGFFAIVGQGLQSLRLGRKQTGIVLGDCFIEKTRVRFIAQKIVSGLALCRGTNLL